MNPTTQLDQRYSYPEATATPWTEARAVLEQAELYWISTVRPDGRPHVTPLIGVWADDALHFCAGDRERKAKNLAGNPNVVLTTGANAWHEGLDVVVEGHAVGVADDELHRLADAWVAKYGEVWRFDVADGAFQGEGGAAPVYRVAPVTAFAFAKGDEGGQTRYSF